MLYGITFENISIKVKIFKSAILKIHKVHTNTQYEIHNFYSPKCWLQIQSKRKQ